MPTKNVNPKIILNRAVKTNNMIRNINLKFIKYRFVKNVNPRKRKIDDSQKLAIN